MSTDVHALRPVASQLTAVMHSEAAMLPKLPPPARSMICGDGGSGGGAGKEHRHAYSTPYRRPVDCGDARGARIAWLSAPEEQTLGGVIVVVVVVLPRSNMPT